MTIKFGTDGWRAVISDTFTFGNLRLVAQALADYVWEENEGSRKPEVVVGFDTRFLSDRYAIEVARVLAAGKELLQECIDSGGSVTAEHGIGVEKIDFMERQFSGNDLAAMGRVKAAFNPSGRLGPGKLLPSDGADAVVQTSPARRGMP